jgi:predicted dehydrogenase
MAKKSAGTTQGFWDRPIMSFSLTPEERKIGADNFHRLVGGHGISRRDFMKGMLAAGATLPISAAAYFGYQKLSGRPVRAGLIGAGDQGGVLVGSHNPEFLEFVAYCDIRPSNQERIFRGEAAGPRKGFERIYGAGARRNIKLYERYQDLLADPAIEAVVIALPLHLHGKVAIDAMERKKHVFCEKLMAKTVAECKAMVLASQKHRRVLAIGHQRHYSLLYAHASEILRAGDLGEVRHIRAQWNRNNTWPLVDAAGKPMRDARTGQPLLRDSWRPMVPTVDRDHLASRIQDWGYPSVEKLVRWRLYRATSEGLMAELGSHQLDACSLFLDGARSLAVSGVGGKLFFRDDRDVDDHVFATFEFPGKNYWKDRGQSQVGDADDRVIVTYSAGNTNALDSYGEWVMGTRGTMLVDAEEEVLIYPEAGQNSRAMSVTVSSPGPGMTVLDSSATTTPGEQAALARGQAALANIQESRGYREELEDFAFCVRMWERGTERRPRCDGEVALADAVTTLAANQAIRQGRRVVFQQAWFDPNSELVPD